MYYVAKNAIASILLQKIAYFKESYKIPSRKRYRVELCDFIQGTFIVTKKNYRIH